MNDSTIEFEPYGLINITCSSKPSEYINLLTEIGEYFRSQDLKHKTLFENYSKSQADQETIEKAPDFLFKPRFFSIFGNMDLSCDVLVDDLQWLRVMPLFEYALNQRYSFHLVPVINEETFGENYADIILPLEDVFANVAFQRDQEDLPEPVDEVLETPIYSQIILKCDAFFKIQYGLNIHFELIHFALRIAQRLNTEDRKLFIRPFVTMDWGEVVICFRADSLSTINSFLEALSESKLFSVVTNEGLIRKIVHDFQIDYVRDLLQSYQGMSSDQQKECLQILKAFPQLGLKDTYEKKTWDTSDLATYQHKLDESFGSEASTLYQVFYRDILSEKPVLSVEEFENPNKFLEDIYLLVYSNSTLGVPVECYLYQCAVFSSKSSCENEIASYLNTQYTEALVKPGEGLRSAVKYSSTELSKKIRETVDVDARVKYVCAIGKRLSENLDNNRNRNKCEATIDVALFFFSDSKWHELADTLDLKAVSIRSGNFSHRHLAQDAHIGGLLSKAAAINATFSNGVYSSTHTSVSYKDSYTIPQQRPEIKDFLKKNLKIYQNRDVFHVMFEILKKVKVPHPIEQDLVHLFGLYNRCIKDPVQFETFLDMSFVIKQLEQLFLKMKTLDHHGNILDENNEVLITTSALIHLLQNFITNFKNSFLNRSIDIKFDPEPLFSNSFEITGVKQTVLSICSGLYYLLYRGLVYDKDPEGYWSAVMLVEDTGFNSSRQVNIGQFTTMSSLFVSNPEFLQECLHEVGHGFSLELAKDFQGEKTELTEVDTKVINALSTQVSVQEYYTLFDDHFQRHFDQVYYKTSDEIITKYMKALSIESDDHTLGRTRLVNQLFQVIQSRSYDISTEVIPDLFFFVHVCDSDFALFVDKFWLQFYSVNFIHNEQIRARASESLIFRGLIRTALIYFINSEPYSDGNDLYFQKMSDIFKALRGSSSFRLEDIDILQEYVVTLFRFLIPYQIIVTSRKLKRILEKRIQKSQDSQNNEQPDSFHFKTDLFRQDDLAVALECCQIIKTLSAGLFNNNLQKEFYLDFPDFDQDIDLTKEAKDEFQFEFPNNCAPVVLYSAKGILGVTPESRKEIFRRRVKAILELSNITIQRRSSLVSHLISLS